MRLTFCFLLCISILPTLTGQDQKIDVALDYYLNNALKAEAAIARDSIAHYRKLITATEVKGKGLMGNDKVSGQAFGHGGPQAYENLYGLDTGRMVWIVVEQWRQYLNRHQGWRHYAARVQELKSKNGHKELKDRYGDRLLATLENKKRLTELVRRELVRGVLFFHKWHDGVNKYARFPTLYEGGYQSIAEVTKDTKDFKFRKSPPDPVASVTAGGSLAPEDILFSYPQNQQANFYRMENARETGAVALRNYAGSSLREPSRNGKLWARWKSSKGEVLFTRAVVGGSRINFRVPVYFLKARGMYEMSIVKTDTELYDEVLDFYAKKELSQIINRGVFHRDIKNSSPEETFFTAYFRVSQYGSFYGKTLQQQFTKVDGPGTAYQFAVDEAFGPEEVNGLHGATPLSTFSTFGCSAADDVLNKVYGSAANAFYSHPNQEYVDYLKRNRDSLNIDSLVAIEFLPFKERLKKYRWMRYQSAEGKRLTPFSRKLPLPAKPSQQTCLFRTAATQPITEAVFRDPSSYNLKTGTLILRDTFADATQRIALKVAPLLEERAAEYANILSQLNKLSPQGHSGKSYPELVKALNYWYVVDPRNEKLVGLKTCFPNKVNLSYSFPLRAWLMTSLSMELAEAQE